MTDAEFKQILDYFDRLQSPSTRMAIRFMMFTGLRVGEVCRLHKENFDKKFTRVTFEVEKSHKIMERLIPSRLSSELRQYHMKYHMYMRDGYLFFPFKNQSLSAHISPACIQNKFGQMRKDLGFDQAYYITRNGKRLCRISPHTCRHYAIWRYYKASGNCIKTAQEIIGHTQIETTARYINVMSALTEEKRKEIVERAFA